MNNDLTSFNLTTNTTAECATACSNFAGCIGWVMAPSGSCGAQPFCWLKSMMAAVTPNPCRISGILVRARAAAVGLHCTAYRSRVRAPTPIAVA